MSLPSHPVELFIRDLKHSRLFEDQIIYHGVEPEKEEVMEAIPGFLSPLSRSLLEAMGIEGLYSHQVKALSLIREGKDVVIATPTASGKTLIYHLATLESFFRDPEATALYLFPLKALARDQLKEFDRLVKYLPGDGPLPWASVYDGDTPSEERGRIRKECPNVVMTNPDMLHLGILPNHQRWHRFFMHLSHIVVDEVHTYRGIMGSHMAWVFRRLIRICNLYGAYPRFIICSATIGNPREHSCSLIGRDVECVSKSGAGRGKRHFIFINPLLYGAPRAGFILLQSALHRDIRTIVYTNSRRVTELIGAWCKQRLSRFADRIGVYRAGFLPEDRRKIEKALNSGRLRAVISTSALEAGINVGGLDMCVLVGYPGSIMATYQRAGRVGREGNVSAVILIAGEDNLDQYFMKYPQEFFSLSPEHVTINPYNERIMEMHLLCCAADMPVKRGESILDHPRVGACISRLLKDKRLVEREGSLFCTEGGIHQRVNLRGMGSPLVIRETSGEIIGEIDLVRAHRETYPGAVYLHNTLSYVVQEMDVPGREVVCEKRDVKYFTRLCIVKHTRILEEMERKRVGEVEVGYGRLEITEEFPGYERRRIKDQSLLGFCPLEMDPLLFETEGFWIEFPLSLREDAEKRFLHFMGGIHGLEHLFIGVMPHLVLVDRNDIGGISIPMHPQISSPAVFVYDGVAGGIGISREVFSRIEDLFDLSYKVISQCECELGCFRCIYSPRCGSGNRPLDKSCSLFLLSSLWKKEGDIEHSRDRRIYVNVSSGDDFGVLDIETQRSAREVGGWQNAAGMRVSCAVLYMSDRDEIRVFTEEEVPDLIEILMGLSLVVGFNILGFDYRVLAPYSPKGLSSIPTLDMLRDIHLRLGYRVSLDNIARATLNISKSANGMLALKWWKEGKMDKIIQYCKRDVEITRDVFLFGREKGFIYFTNKSGSRVRLEVNWNTVTRGRR